jgi:tetratricopeptide (TPR) repeat protein
MANPQNHAYLPPVRFYLLILVFCCGLPSQAATWAQIQQSPDYLTAKKHLADFFPDQAIPPIQALLVQPDLDQTAKASLLSLLGEAQVRAALDAEDPLRSLLLTDALKTLDDRSLREFSPAHLWRSHALSNLGRLRDAIGELERIDRRNMMDQANLQMASLLITIGDAPGAKSKLTPLLKSQDPALVKSATLHLISVALSQEELKEADRFLTTYKPENPNEEGLQRYLTGRLQLARGERLQAGGTFQNLTTSPEIAKFLPSKIFHEATLALADSLALENNEEAGVTSLLQTLEKYPDSPRLESIFARFEAWSPKIETASLITKLENWVPKTEPYFRNFPDGLAVTTTQAIPPLRSLYALEFIATMNLQSEEPTVRAEGVQQMEQLQLAGRIDSPLIHRSLLTLGMAHMKEENYQGALTLFNLLDESSRSPIIKAYARALAGQAFFAIDQPAEASTAFLEARRIATREGEAKLRAVSELNAAITLLATTRSKDLDEMTTSLKSPEAKSFLILERGLFLSTKNDPAARDLLASFIADFPNSPRKDEATLSLAESAVFAEPSEPELIELARGQVPYLKFDLETQPLLEARRILVLLTLEIGQDQAENFLTKAPDHPLAPRILFRLGQTQRSVDPIGKAYNTFEKVLTQYPESEFADAARYLSARSAASSGTETAQQDAIVRFGELIAGKGVLANEATISLASLLIDREQQKDALDDIKSSLETAKLTSNDRRRLLILGADALGQLGRLEDALDYYEILLRIKDIPISTRNRASFQRGAALERLDRKAEALECYLSVVNRDFDPVKTTSLEWKWFDKCGIEGALALLEREKRYRAFISLAEKLGKSGSPRSKEARESAERIGLDQRIWRGR